MHPQKKTNLQVAITISSPAKWDITKTECILTKKLNLQMASVFLFLIHEFIFSLGNILDQNPHPQKTTMRRDRKE